MKIDCTSQMNLKFPLACYIISSSFQHDICEAFHPLNQTAVYSILLIKYLNIVKSKAHTLKLALKVPGSTIFYLFHP